jgi:hypothetical protein
MEGRDDRVHDPVGIVKLSGSVPDAGPIQRLGLFNGLDKDCQSRKTSSDSTH